MDKKEILVFNQAGRYISHLIYVYLMWAQILICPLSMDLAPELRVPELTVPVILSTGVCLIPYVCWERKKRWLRIFYSLS